MKHTKTVLDKVQDVSYTSPVRYRALSWIFLVFGTGLRFCFRRLFDDPNLKWKKIMKKLQERYKLYSLMSLHSRAKCW